MSKLRIIGFNANSIGKQPKRRQVLNFLEKKDPDLLVIVDTRFSTDIENGVKSEWGGQVLFSSFTSQSRGVAIFIKKNLPIKVLDKFNDKNGNILGILIEYENKKILIEGIYGPNGDAPTFYENEVFKNILNWDPQYSIFVGDWNLVLDQNIDTLNYQSVNNPLARLEILKKIAEHNLVDIFRELHPDSKKFSWKQWGNQKFARLDYFLVSNTLLPFVEKADILPTCFSDHSPIILEIDFSRFSRGKGFWKFNNSLLKDIDYLEMIKNLIKRVVCQYATVEGNPNYFNDCSVEILQQFLSHQTPESLQTLDININPELFLDTLLMEIRGATIKYSSKKKRDNKATEQLLMHDIEILETQLQRNTSLNAEIIDELETKKDALENLIKHEAEGAFVRSRIRYKLEGEKPSKLFCSLEKQNGTQRYVPQLVVENTNGQEVIINEQSKVEAEIRRFYKDLFANKDNNNPESVHDFLGQSSNSLRKLSENQKNSMEGEISLQEMSNYLKKCKNSVAPGASGFTFDFYKFFWRDLRYFIKRSIDYAFENNRLAVSQSLGIISIIPKGEKDKRFLNNWRPLCLLNSLYKIISGAISERIKPAMDSIIHGDQKGFVAGRYIGEVVRTTFDIIQYAKDNNKTGLLLLVDFDKAYDSVSFKFINKTLKIFNFGDDLIKWVNILLKNFKAVVNHCGNISENFSIGRGCRQGDPIACYLFILSIEILAHKLREDNTVKGFEVDNMAHLLEIYADDLTLYLSPKADNLRRVIEILERFHRISGLKISVSKTKAVWFGSDYNSNIKLCPDLDLKWVRNFTLLGINFNNNLIGMESNFNQKLETIDKMLASWLYRYLTPYGKITIIKTLALSKLSHVALIIPNPTKQMFKQIETIFFKFLWNNKSEKVSREDAKLPENFGGLNMPDIANFWLSFKFSWLRRLLTTSAFWPHILLKQIYRSQNLSLNPSQLLQLGPSLLRNVGKNITNNFWKQVLFSAVNVTEGAIFTYPEKIGSSSFWYNPFIKRNNKYIIPAQFPQIAGSISTLSDFFYPCSNVVMNKEDFCIRYGLEIEENDFIELRYIISLALQKLKIVNQRIIPAFRPFKPLLIDISLSTKKGCSAYYKILMKSKIMSNKIAVREQKWHTELNSTFSIFFWEKARKLCASIKYENPLKWLQFQIIRNSLQTNLIVSHFIANIGPECYYCQLSNEQISHLFWLCPIVSRFLEEVFDLITEYGILFRPTKLQFLFGYLEEAYSTPRNYLTLFVKKFIWNCKFKSDGGLSIVGFKSFLVYILGDIKKMYEITNKPAYFDEWNDLFVHLIASLNPLNPDQHGQPPPQVLALLPQAVPP